jgi:phosphoribosylformylglycinamidine cyclo-ligase
VKSALAAVRQGGVHGLAHITGGGLTENLPRVLPEGLGAEIDLDRLGAAAGLRLADGEGGLAEAEMLKTFNCGIGMVLWSMPERAEALAARLLAAAGRDGGPARPRSAGQGVAYSGALA